MKLKPGSCALYANQSGNGTSSFYSFGGTAQITDYFSKDCKYASNNIVLQDITTSNSSEALSTA